MAHFPVNNREPRSFSRFLPLVWGTSSAGFRRNRASNPQTADPSKPPFWGYLNDWFALGYLQQLETLGRLLHASKILSGYESKRGSMFWASFGVPLKTLHQKRSTMGYPYFFFFLEQNKRARMLSSDQSGHQSSDTVPPSFRVSSRSSREAGWEKRHGAARWPTQNRPHI